MLQRPRQQLTEDENGTVFKIYAIANILQQAAYKKSWSVTQPKGKMINKYAMKAKVYNTFL